MIIILISSDLAEITRETDLICLVCIILVMFQNYIPSEKIHVDSLEVVSPFYSPD